MKTLFDQTSNNSYHLTAEVLAQKAQDRAGIVGMREKGKKNMVSFIYILTDYTVLSQVSKEELH